MNELNDYRRMLHQALEIQGSSNLIPLADDRLCGQLMKSFSPARARAFVASAAIAQARADLSAQIGKVPSDEIAIREAEINALAARLG